MFSLFFVLALLGSFASQALAFNVTVGKQVLDVSQILTIPDSPVKAACSANCTDASSKIAACNNDAACLCSDATVKALFECENCMLHFLIQTNKPMPDFRAGSNVLMGGYAASCKDAKVIVPAEFSALTLPSTWDGPFVAVLPVGVAAVYAAFGGILGLSALYILSNLE